MYPTPHDYHLSQIERLTAAFATVAPHQQKDTESVTIYVAAGEPIFSGHEPESNAYIVTSGEVLMFRYGCPVDLLEAGELLDLRIWRDAMAVALKNCTLVRVATPAIGQLS